MMTKFTRSHLPKYYPYLKACLDFLFALLLMILCAPLLLLLGLLIRLDSPGPIIYRQRRLGRHGKLFTIYKLRTMKIDAPCLSTEEMQRSGYNHVTRLGVFLRKSNLDELPQLVNIIKGEMSFIGPRPALPSQTDLNNLREELGVHQVRPGITGLAQVMRRDNLETATKVRYDKDYCQRMNLSLDIKIVALTFAVFLSSRENI